MIRPKFASLTCAVLALAAGTASAQQLTTVRVANNMARPVFVTAPPGDTSRIFIAEQRGSGGVANRADIRILNLSNNQLVATPFLSLAGVATGSEQGLLGLAFDPDYDKNGFFYVHYNPAGGATQITRYKVSASDPNVADPASATPVLSQSQPFSNHNGGWIGFGPDGYLYIALGDGGSACDPQGNALNLNSLLGKMLRIDVSTLPYTIPSSNPFAAGGGRGEIWAYGLRNPWRNSFDRETGDLYIGDVGQDVQEEINIQPAGVAGRNYGWDCREGLVCSSTSPSNCPTPAVCAGCVLAGATDPVWVIPHSGTSTCSITGGYVYRGCAIPELRGTYFFTDYCSGLIQSFRWTGGPVTSVQNRTAELAVPGFTINAIVSFGEDANGELYICDQGGGEIYKIIPRCPVNCDGSSTAPVLNVNDFVCFQQRFAANDCYANCDGSTTPPVLNVNDFVCFQQQFAAGCP